MADSTPTGSRNDTLLPFTRDSIRHLIGDVGRDEWFRRSYTPADLNVLADRIFIMVTQQSVRAVPICKTCGKECDVARHAAVDAGWTFGAAPEGTEQAKREVTDEMVDEFCNNFQPQEGNCGTMNIAELRDRVRRGLEAALNG